MKRVLAVILVLAITAALPGIVYADADGSSVEIGVEWVGQYTGTESPAAQYGDLNTSDDAALGLYDIVSDPNTSWGWQFNFGNGSAWERDWRPQVALVVMMQHIVITLSLSHSLVMVTVKNRIQ